MYDQSSSGDLYPIFNLSSIKLFENRCWDTFVWFSIISNSFWRRHE